MNQNNDIAMLAYELTYHRYLVDNDKAQNLFTELTPSEYIALHKIMKAASENGILTQKTYLKDLADGMEVSIHSISKMVGELKDRGLVKWSHDGNGSDGTYITLTESGIGSMTRQENILSEYYSRVIDQFGHDNLIALLKQMEVLEEIMNSEFAEKENNDGNGSTV